MNEAQNWDRNMSDEQFVALSLGYFKKRFWTLHEGCCLVAKVNPLIHPGVGKGYEHWTEDDQDDLEYDYTRRPFLVALRAVLARTDQYHSPFEEPALSPHRIDRPVKNGHSVLVEVVTFSKWVIQRWPHQSGHFERALEERNSRKSKSRDVYLSMKGVTAAEIREQKQKEAFVAMMSEIGPKENSLTARELGMRLEKRIKSTMYAAGHETLRKKVGLWRVEAHGLPKSPKKTQKD